MLFMCINLIDHAWEACITCMLRNVTKFKSGMSPIKYLDQGVELNTTIIPAFGITVYIVYNQLLQEEYNYYTSEYQQFI